MDRKKNPNAPPAGEPRTTEPLRNKEDIERIRQMLLLSPNPRDLALFAIGIGMNIQVVEIMKLKVGDFKVKKPGDILEVRNAANSKPKRFVITQDIHDAVQRLLWFLRRHCQKRLSDSCPLFVDLRRGFEHPQAMTTIHLHKLVRGWCATAGIEGDYGAVSLRKTWFQLQKDSGVPESYLQKLLGDGNQLNRFLCLPESNNTCDAQRSSRQGNAKIEHFHNPQYQHESLPLFF